MGSVTSVIQIFLLEVHQIRIAVMVRRPCADKEGSKNVVVDLIVWRTTYSLYTSISRDTDMLLSSIVVQIACHA